MSYKSKKSGQHGHIKTGIAGIVAMAVIVIIVLIVNTATLNANVVVVRYSKGVDYDIRCEVAQPNPFLTKVQCEADGIAQCKNLNPPYELPMSKGDICFDKCVWHVKDVCKDAPLRYQYMT